MNYKITRELLTLAQETQKICRAINHPIRTKMIRIISEAGEITVTDIQKKIGLEQTETSQQLRILREAGWVSSKKNELNGKFILYFVNAEKVNLFTESFSNVIYGKSESN